MIVLSQILLTLYMQEYIFSLTERDSRANSDLANEPRRVLQIHPIGEPGHSFVRFTEFIYSAYAHVRSIKCIPALCYNKI